MNHILRPAILCALLSTQSPAVAAQSPREKNAKERQPVQFAPLRSGTKPSGEGAETVDKPSGEGLRGLRSLRVVVAAGFSKHGVDVAQLRAGIERQLTAAGIEIVSGEPGLENRTAELSINISTIRDTENDHIVEVRGRVVEDVVLARDRSVTTRAAVWEGGPNVSWRGELSGGDPDLLGRAVQVVIGSLIRDHLRVNQR